MNENNERNENERDNYYEAVKARKLGRGIIMTLGGAAIFGLGVLLGANMSSIKQIGTGGENGGETSEEGGGTTTE